MLFSRSNRLTTALANVRETIFEYREESPDISAPVEILTGHKHPLARHGITGLDGLSVRTLTREETDEWEVISPDGFILVPAEATPAADDAGTELPDEGTDAGTATTDSGMDADAWADGSEEYGDPHLTDMDGSGYEAAHRDEPDYRY